MNARARRAQRHADEHGPTGAPYETADRADLFEIDEPGPRRADTRRSLR